VQKKVQTDVKPKGKKKTTRKGTYAVKSHLGKKGLPAGRLERGERKAEVDSNQLAGRRITGVFWKKGKKGLNRGSGGAVQEEGTCLERREQHET